MNKANIENALKELKHSSRVSLFMVLLGVACLIGSLYYSFTRLTPLEKQIAEKALEVDRLSQIEKEYREDIEGYKKVIANLKLESERLKRKLASIEDEVEKARLTQNSILDFLISVTDRQKIHLLGRDVDWAEVKKQIFSLPASDRKHTMLKAILLAWKDIPFTLRGNNIGEGFNSPGFIKYVLGQSGINITSNAKPLSEAIVDTFQEVTYPRPGDLVFFKGEAGNFGFILLSVGSSLEEHIGVGTLEEIDPLQIITLGKIYTQDFPLRGYYRVVYNDEK